MPVVVVPHTSVEDCTIYDGGAADTNHNNMGGFVDLYIGESDSGTTRYRTLMRFDETLIPDGTITQFTLKLYRKAFAGAIVSGNVDIFRITDPNTWVEGTGAGFLDTIQTGSVDWDHCKHATQSWAGSGGCGTSGTDYDSDASPPTYAFSAYTTGPDVLVAINLPVVWATDWRDGVRVNNGILLRERVISATNFSAWRSTEFSSNQPTFEITYADATRNHLFFKVI